MKTYPSRQEAEELLKDAEAANPGLWGDHSRMAAKCAEKIAGKVGMNAEKAYVLGLLHDVGRKFLVRDMGHLYYGYKYMNSLGYTDVAKVCRTLFIRRISTRIWVRQIFPKTKPKK